MYIEQYVIELCKLLNVKAYGNINLVHFGEDEKIAGFSMVQLIETSSITGHFVDNSSSAYIDIFSCRHYDYNLAVDFTKSFFEAKKINYHFLNRD